MSKKPLCAYFCMEYGLDPSFKIYSGGLGILAGDILKAAHDLEMPMVGVGILWRQGYDRQVIHENGRPMDCFPEYRYDFLKDTGVEVSVEIRGREVRAKVWLCDCFGNVPLYLLDTNLPDNNDSLLTGQLYGWFNEERIAQEMILGIGGIRALEALHMKPDLYHFNDSHPAFAGLELIRREMEKDGITFQEARESVRRSIVFTTHTPVEAGNEVHSHDLLQYMGAYNGLDKEDIIDLGGDPFNMTVASLRMSYMANGVAQLHGETARKMWAKVEDAAPILAITNGVHNGTWQDAQVYSAYREEGDLMAAHGEAKRKMIDEIERRNGVRLKEDVLTIGFARRAAPYKRGNLIFGRMEVVEPLLKEGKLQIIFSGKAHPNDLTGKDIVAEYYAMSQKYPESIVFVQDYDMTVGALLTRGCDVWLNNPRRPMEASGTSGMKAAMNGVLNLSVLDGWWPEGCEHGANGWQIGDGYEGEDQDELDRESLYKVLLTEVIPTYYEDKEKWAKMMRASISMATDRFSAARMVHEYYDLMYSQKPEENTAEKKASK
ncbi:alpha-glucan family phosphorylase [Solibaculum mannosilyticum]|uniref:glycogen phosphorylase n=1 Tax=Solibaculum mannosilyticum TaxID=2780922 RepID=A0A7I8D564_9FIRM|nr:alpha-glucan family phosphorylase [Solibaculum mannosilyticum]BCI60932.1 alpha-1,4 glucan phosphorylase [Solibaculum mannosilyticum]